MKKRSLTKLRLKRLSAFILTALVVLPLFSLSVFANGNQLPDASNAESVCLYNLNTQSAVYRKNENKPIAPGGTVKMMTGIIACEMLSDRLHDEVTVTQDMLEGVIGFKIKLQAGMVITVQDLLYGVLCGSGNDAAAVVSRLCAESTEAFVELMNNKAQELEMEHTYYTNPTGIDEPEMQTTLADTMLLAEYVSQNQLYMDISSVSSYSIATGADNEALKIYNRNALISNFSAFGYTNPNAYGMSSGVTDNSGYCVVTYSERNGTAYICAVMGAVSDDQYIYSYKIANELLDYAFANRVYKQLAFKHTLICSVDVKYVMPDDEGNPVKLDCYINEDIYALTYKNINVEKDLEYRYYFHRDELVAPISEGAIVGGVDILYNGEVLSSTYLYAGSTVKPEGIIYRIDQLRAFFSGSFFIAFGISLVILLSVYLYFFEYSVQRIRTKLFFRKIWRKR